ncbi:DUF334 domain-containing protein [Acinetobacter radioresistens]|nr:DUF334 domain-containing protein [Acinetobacter radioresistens]
MSLRNGNNNQSTTSQTNTESTGTQSNEKQSDLNRKELNELKKQNKLLVKFITELQHKQTEHETQKAKLITDLREKTKDFQDKNETIQKNFVKSLNGRLHDVDTTEINRRVNSQLEKIRSENKAMWEEMKKIQENYKKRIRFLYFTLGTIMLVFMFLALAMTIGSDLLSFFNIETLQKAIASKIKGSEGFISFLWYIAYYVPYIVFFGIFIFLYEWLRKKLDERYF